ncbi:hypothetical protein VYI39_10070 [Streptococcus anginosus]|nr:hypothetical protein [Streptococcus anginosus]
MYSYEAEGKTGRDLVEEALQLGADCVGGIPHNEWARSIGEDSIKEIVRLALKYDKYIDVHCDETDDTQARFLELLNAEVLKQSYVLVQQRVILALLVQLMMLMPFE